MNEDHGNWFEQLDERQQKEVEMAITYNSLFRHGTDGHNRLILIAQLAGMLDAQSVQIEALTIPKEDGL